jgi:DNA polymerase III subunit epsilon
MREIYYDTETTGVSVENDRIVEIAAYDPERDKAFVELVNPGVPMPVEASRVNNITDDMLSTADDFRAVGQRFIDFCDGDVVLIAHNNDRFDMPFIHKEFSRNQLDVPEWNYLDSLKWARRYRYDLPKHNLQFLRDEYGVKANNAHRALDDVKVLYQIFKKMTDDLPIEIVYKLMKQPRLVTRMPFGKHKGKALKEVPKSYVRWLDENGALDKDDNQQLKMSFQKAGILS